MKLGNATLRPGKILEVSEEIMGEIKVEAPGLFTKEDPIENLPPIMPFFLLHPNTYSHPVVGEEVWIINFSDNPRALFWLKKDDYKTNLEKLKKDGVLEVICHRPWGDETNASIYFSDGSGWVISSNGIINIDKDGQIHIKSQGKSIINVTNEQIDINSPGGTQVLVKDDNVQINAGSTVNVTDSQIDINSPGGTQAIIKDNNIQLKTNSSGSINLSPGSVKLADGTYSAVNGEQLKIVLDNLISLIMAAAAIPIAPGAPPVALGAVGTLLTQTANILAKNVKVS